MTNERPLDPPEDAERETYYESLFKGSRDNQLTRLGTDPSDFIEWLGDTADDIIYCLASNDRALPKVQSKRVCALLDKFIDTHADKAMRAYDLEGLPYEGQ